MGSVAAFLLLLNLATAHTVGEPCPFAVENCEKWSTIVQGPVRPAGERPDEFPIAIAVNSTTAFAGVHAVNLVVADPYSSTASWTLAAYDLNTGAERWHVFRHSRPYDSLHDIAISPDGDTVVGTGGAFDGFPVGATDSRIVTVAYDAATGAERWSATWDNSTSSVDNPVAVRFSPDGRSVYVGAITAPNSGEVDYVTIAYDATNGAQQWISIYNGLGPGRINSLKDLAVSPDGKRVYVTGESDGARQYEIDFATVAYDASNGDRLWVSRSQPTFVDRACCLAVDQGHIYVTGDSTDPNGSDYEALTLALSVTDGSVAWQQRLGGSGYSGGRAITVGGGRVVVAAQSPSTRPDQDVIGVTAAYDSMTGRQQWVTQLAEPLRSQLPNDITVAPDGKHVYVVANSRPSIPNTKLLDQEVIAYNLINGSTAWSVHMDSGPINAMSGDKIAVTRDGNSVITLGQITYSADPLGSADQNIYDSIVVALPAVFGSIPSPTASPTVTPTPTATPTPTPSSTPRVSPTPTPTSTATATPTPSATPTPTSTPRISPTPTPAPTSTPTATPTPTPTVTPSPVQLIRVVSRMAHASASPFDIVLRESNPPSQGFLATECRSGGTNGNYNLVFKFADALTNVGSAHVTSGTGSISSSKIDPNDAHNYIVNLTGVADAQIVTVVLTGVTDSAGHFSSSVSAAMGVLIGDTNSDRFTDSVDASQTKSESGHAISDSNFREDVNADGFIDAVDASLVKSKSGHALR